MGTRGGASRPPPRIDGVFTAIFAGARIKPQFYREGCSGTRTSHLTPEHLIMHLAESTSMRVTSFCESTAPVQAILVQVTLRREPLQYPPPNQPLRSPGLSSELGVRIVLSAHGPPT